MTELVCPKCGGQLEVDDYYDSEESDEEIFMFACGHCVSCGTNYQWSRVYVFDRYDDLMEDD